MDANAARPKANPAKGITFPRPPRSSENQRARALPHFARDAEEQRDRKSVREHQSRRAVHPENVRAGDPEKNVAHVHHARIAEHPIEPLLRDRDQSDVNDVPEQQDDEQVVPVLRAFRQKRNRQTQQAVESEFLQHSGVQHRRRRRSRGVRFRRPGVKWKKRNENAESDQQHQINVVLRIGGDLTGSGGCLQSAKIKTPRGFGQTAVEQDQAEQQNEAADREVDRDFPRRGIADFRCPKFR